MKKTLVAIAALMLAAAAHAQGTLNFNNRIAGGVLDAPITTSTDPVNTGAGTLAGALAQLFLVNGTTLTPVGTAVSFRGNSGALAKYFDGGTITVNGAAVGSSPTLRVRAWAGAATYDAAQFKGESANFTAGPLGGDVGGGNPPALPADLVNLKSFVVVVPEPTTIALGVLGGVALLAARRRK